MFLKSQETYGIFFARRGSSVGLERGIHNAKVESSNLSLDTFIQSRPDREIQFQNRKGCGGLQAW